MGKYQEALDHIGEFAYEHNLYESINLLQDLINNYSNVEKALDRACEELSMVCGKADLKTKKCYVTKEEWKEWLLKDE